VKNGNKRKLAARPSILGAIFVLVLVGISFEVTMVSC
jgi:hypothetical protein